MANAPPSGGPAKRGGGKGERGGWVEREREEEVRGRVEREERGSEGKGGERGVGRKRENEE